MIKLEQTDDEYLLFVPYDQRDRARRISGRRWDGSLRCWRIPKNAHSTGELVHEFGEEIALPEQVRASSGSKQLDTSKQRDAERTDPRENSIGAEQGVACATSADKGEHDLLSLVERLTDREVRLAAASSELATLRNRLEASGTYETKLAEANAELSQLRAELSELRERPKVQRQPAPSRSGLNDALLTVIGMLFPADRNTQAIADAVQSDPDLPFTLGRAIETDLRVLLKDVADASLFDIISRADESGILSPRSVDLAHLLRKQRNHVAHGKGQRDASVLATNLMCLAATRLLRNELKPSS